MLRAVSVWFLLFVVNVDGASSHSRKTLRTAKRDVDDDGDDDDTDAAPAPAVAEAPAAVAVAPAAPAPAPAKPAKFKVAEEDGVQMHEMMEAAEEMFAEHNISDAKSEHKEELAGLMYIEEIYEDKLADLDEDNYAKTIEKEEIPVANETSPGLASMLGGMREEMHQFAVPFYKKFLKAKLKEVESQQHKLVAEIAKEQSGAPEEIKEEPKITTTAKPAEKKPKGHKKITSNNMLVALALVVFLAAIAFGLSRRQSSAGGRA